MANNGLQIFGATPEEEMPTEAPVEEQMIDPMADPMMGQLSDEGMKVTQEEARYYLPTQRCSNCEHFMEGSCEIVAGEIDPNGICILYRPGQLPMDPMADPTMQETPIEEELPMEDMTEEMSGEVM